MIPQAIQDALNKLVTDRTDLDGLYTTKAQTAATLVDATNKDTVAGNALTAGTAQFEADKASLIQAVQNGLTSGPPTAPTPATVARAAK